MHDLNTINRLNYEAFNASIQNFRAQGRYVLARYEGATLVAIETFSELTHAQWALEIDPAIANRGQRAVVFAPLPAFHAAKRDQSEDRPLPPIEPARIPVKTLGDYVHNVKADLANEN